MYSSRKINRKITSQDPSEGPGLGDREVAATVDFAEQVSRRLADIADTVAGPVQRSLIADTVAGPAQRSLSE